MADLISAVGVFIAAISFVLGVSAWKREFVGKRRIELAESVLALFYEAEDAIREIRSPFSFGGEGQTRKREEHESPEASKLLDQAYAVFERYQKREQLFAQLRSMRYRTMATFGAEAAEPFDDITKVLNEIFVAARMLGTHYWPRQGRVQMTDEEFKRHLEEMHKHEATFWQATSDDDVAIRIHQAVEKVEQIASRAIPPNHGILQHTLSKLKKVISKS